MTTKAKTQPMNHPTKPVRWGWCWVAGILTVLFVAFTVAVKWLDVQVDGAHEIGWASVNFWWRDLIGVSDVWRVVSDVAAVLTLLTLVGVIVWQVVALVRARGIHRATRHWLVLDGALGALRLCYLLFEFVVINYRPILIDGVAEASYPSSHVLLFATVCPLLMLTFWREIKSRPWRAGIVTLGVVLMLIGMVARALSGYHWLTDVLGGVLLGAVLVAWYRVLTV